tara:strand:+ start:9734 stop:10663 length:930 start_codon:yes stop_codon:yes gene_type:complete
MRIAFFTEGNWSGKVERTNQNMRTELAWMCALDADHYNIHEGMNTKYMGRYDLGIVIIPKKNPQFDLENIKKWCVNVAYMQEGPHWYFQDYDIEKQIWFYNTLQDMDMLFVHNEIDKKYFEGLTGKPCRVLPSLMIEDSIQVPKFNRSNVMIGGNFCHWYGGFDSYIVAQEFDCEIHAPSMGRKIANENWMDGLNHLPYMNWVEWIHTLNKYKFGVHLMRTHAAGTFALNCAYLGIPCIGYEGLDTQMNCHPDCTVKVGDITHAKQIAEKLRKDEKFYLYCSNNAKESYKKYYHENQFNTTFKKQLKVS